MIGSIINAEVAPLNGTRRVSTFRPPQLCTPFSKTLLVALRPLSVVLVAAGWMSISAATPSISAHGQDSTSAAQQAPAPIPEFEVATIKPNKPNKASDGMRLMAHTPTGLSVKNIPVLFLIRDAFGLEDDRILCAPAWVKTDRFDIEAKVGESDIPRLKTMTVDQRRLMLRPPFAGALQSEVSLRKQSVAGLRTRDWQRWVQDETVRASWQSCDQRVAILGQRSSGGSRHRNGVCRVSIIGTSWSNNRGQNGA
jgi:Protein of unknown function (DUF3738)